MFHSKRQRRSPSPQKNMVRQNGLVVNKYFREFIVAVSKITKQYAVMLINIITNLSTVMANSNNQTKQELQLSSNNQLSTLEIAGIVIGIIVGIISLFLTYYIYRRQRNNNNGGPNYAGANIGGNDFTGASGNSDIGNINIGNTTNNNSK